MMSLNEDIKTHLSHYLVLLVILNVGIGAFLFFSYSRNYQMMILLLTSLAYVLWGLIHHWFCEDLHLKVVLEYILIALLVNLVLLGLLIRA